MEISNAYRNRWRRTWRSRASCPLSASRRRPLQHWRTTMATDAAKGADAPAKSPKQEAAEALVAHGLLVDLGD